MKSSQEAAMTKRIKSERCRWCGNEDATRLKRSDPAIGPGLYECAVLQACILQLRRKARIVAIYGPDDATPAGKQGSA